MRESIAYTKEEPTMKERDPLTECQRRHLAHIYAALRACIDDEVAYDRTPELAVLDADGREAMAAEIYAALTALMVAAHAEEASSIEARLAVGPAIADWLDGLA
jgi:hypothetical protein